MRIALKSNSAAILLIAITVLGIAQALHAADLPEQLVVWVRNARQHGIDDDKIRQEAREAGWSAVTVNEALSRVHTAVDDKRPSFESDAPGGSLPQPPAAPPSAPSATQAPAAPATHLAPDDYQIGSGDTLQISVWKEPDVTVPSVVVRPDGKITVPLVKEVEVAGLTPRQAEKLIAAGLAEYIKDANVTIVVTAINSKKIYIIGAAKKEGTIPYTYGMTVMQALSEAGGITDYARRKKIYVLRNVSGRDYRLDFNYDEVVRGERMDQNVVLLPGDTVVIPH